MPDAAPDPYSPLESFHPALRTWFRERVGAPTDVQARAWPAIAAGRHVLLTAPTGSGKTFTAFLWALHRFATGETAPGTTRVLYVSPLKALNNDIQRNLLGPLEELRGRFAREGLAFPDLRVSLRSGDTPGGERRRLLRHPPEILITTPESLNLLLLTPAGRDSLRQVATVILDEVHAVAGSKRGVHLITAVDRLVLLAGEFQRIALSATVKPLPAVAAWVGGWERAGDGYRARPVEIVVSRAAKSYAIQVRYPGRGAEGVTGVWESVAAELKPLVAGARSTLIFTNNRRLSERLARLLNEGEPRPVAYAHHGSLSREIRALVEARMKEGSLPAIVATSSLELGIDIGALDQVALVETPPSVSAALQRLGRAGHGVGETSRGVLLASHGRDLLAAAVAVGCILEGDIEEVRPLEEPLDLLAQVIIAMTATEAWDLDSLYAFLRTSHPYRNLARRPFEAVVEMLAGRYADTRIRELKPRLAVDRVDGQARGLKGAVLLAGTSGGTIPDRGYFALRHAGSRARIGELDEEFVWERREGDLFSLGSQSWRVVRIGAADVEVEPAGRTALLAPFWRAEARDRDAHFSSRIGEFLERADARLDDPAFARELVEERRLDPPAAEALLSFLRRQREATGTPLPHRRHLLVEDCGEAPGGGRLAVLHAAWGGRLIRPWAYALAAAWEAQGGRPLEMIQDDDCLLVKWPGDEPRSPAALLDLVHAGNLEEMLRRKLEHTGFFAARFRENAARALLLPRSSPRARVPLWLTRLRSRSLLEAVSAYGDFPIVLETWRECLRDEFALDDLKQRLTELDDGTIRVREATTGRPSPFAEGLIWKQTNRLMYELDRPAAPGAGGARADLIREIAFSSPLRPRVPREVIRGFEEKARRLSPGYAPEDAGELVEWVKERALIPWPEWRALLDNLRAAGGLPEGEHESYLASRVLGVRLPGAGQPAAVAVEALPRLLEALDLPLAAVSLTSAVRPDGTASDPDAPAAPQALEALARIMAGRGREPAAMAEGTPGEEPTGLVDGPATTDSAVLAGLAGQWLRGYGPVPPGLLREAFGTAAPRVEEALADLAGEGKVIFDAIAEDAQGPEFCDAANLETLLRQMRRRSRPPFQALPAGKLPLFLAAWQGLAAPGRDAEGLPAALEKLFGYPAPAGAWEADILPARMMPYQAAWLDALFRDGDLLWFGAGRERLAFAFPEDLDLFLPRRPPGEPPAEKPPGAEAALDLLSRSAPARLDFPALAARVPAPSESLAAALWGLAWESRITNDTFAALRRGVETGFRAAPASPAGPAAQAPRRGRFARWKASRPLAGSWLALDPVRPETADDPLEREELAKDRVRLLLRRHGVLFRELLAHELPLLQWPQVFRALRLLELGGEALSGHFFEGVPGLQFLAPAALPLLEDGLPAQAVYWMSAQDPASPCGLGLEGLPWSLPPRASGVHLAFHGPDLALVSRRLGRDLVINVPPRHPYLVSYFGALRHLAERAFLPVKAVETETVNGVGALGSPYLEDMLEAGFEKGFKTLSLRRRLA